MPTRGPAVSYTMDDLIAARAEINAAREAETNTYPGATFEDRLMAQYIHMCGRPDPRTPEDEQ